jgi:hypothetical protein
MEIKQQWNPNEDIDEQAKEATEAMQAQENELNKLHVRVFNTEDGKKLLDYYRTNTTDLPTFLPNLGFENGAAMGFHRDGQNSIIREITIRTKRGIEL